MVAALVVWSLTAAAQTPAPAPGTQKPGMAPRPPLLFGETFRIPPHTGEETDENTRVTIYVAVDDPQSQLDRIEQLGGKTVVPVTCVLLILQGISETIKSVYAWRTGVVLEHKEKIEI